MQQYTIVLPVNDNDGVPFGSLLQDIEVEMGATFGGFTKLPGLTGGWVDFNGRLLVEPVSAYWVGVADEDKLTSWLFRIGKRLRQRAIYYTRPDNTAEILTIWRP